jgi:hypothetical protein
VEEGLTSGVADTQPDDKQITAVEWFEYASRRVPQLQMQALEEATSKGRALTFDADDRNATGRIQTPRLYRRDDATPAPVIAKR